MPIKYGKVYYIPMGYNRWGIDSGVNGAHAVAFGLNDPSPIISSSGP